MCTIPAASNLAHVPKEDWDFGTASEGDIVHYHTRELAKLLASEWEQDWVVSYACSDACKWKGGVQHTRHKSSLISYSSRLKYHGTMFPQRSWFPDPLTCGWHSESRTQTDYDSHIWHRYPSSCCVREWIVPWIIVASIWKCKEFSLHLCPWDCGSFGPWEISHSLDVSHFPRLWYCLPVWGMGEENSLESMECFPSCHRCFLPPSKSTGWCYRLCYGSSGKICHLPLWQDL